MERRQIGLALAVFEGFLVKSLGIENVFTITGKRGNRIQADSRCDEARDCGLEVHGGGFVFNFG